MGVNAPPQRESALDRIAKVLGIANAGVQIGANVYGVKKGMDESALAQAAAKVEDSPLAESITGRAKAVGISIPEGTTLRQAKANHYLESIEKGEQFKHDLAKIDREKGWDLKKAGANPAKMAYEQLPHEKQIQITKLSDKIAAKTDIANQIDADLGILNDPNISEDQKLSRAQGMIKTLNSTQGQDAVGVEEAKRLASYLEFHVIPNFTQPGAIVGRAPITDFAQQADITAQTLRKAVESSNRDIDSLYGRTSQPGKTVQEPIEIALKYPQKKAALNSLMEKATANNAPDSQIEIINGHPYQKVNGGWSRIKPKGQ